MAEPLAPPFDDRAVPACAPTRVSPDEGTTPGLFDAEEPFAPEALRLGPGTVLLRRFACEVEDALVEAVQRVVTQAPTRQLLTPGGARMSVAMTNCGPLGWVSDRRGYRYAALDPLSGVPWPPLPEAFRVLAGRAAAAAGFADFEPDACLVNRYRPGARLSLHQDRDERDLGAPIVSVSLGLAAVFLLGGPQRGGPLQRVPLVHGDVIVWGGLDRLRFHGVAPLAEGRHPRLGAQRINLTFRRAG